MDCFVKMEDQDLYFINHQEDHFLTDIFTDQKPFNSNQSQLIEDKKYYFPASRTNFQDNEFLSKEQKIITQICDHIDLKLCHLSDIKNHLQRFYWQQNFNKKRLMQMIVKKKLKLKRQQAKKKASHKAMKKLQQMQQKKGCNNRTSSNYIDLLQNQEEYMKNQTRIIQDCKKQESFSQYVFANQCCDEIQKKKKRNRVSAQISRDKKKQYIKTLQSQIDSLKELRNNNKKMMEEKQCLNIIISQQSQKISQFYQFVQANQQINRKLLAQNIKLKQQLEKVVFLLHEQNQEQIDMKVSLFAFQKLTN